MNLTVSVQHPVETAFRTDIQTTPYQDTHDLHCRQLCDFMFVAAQQDSLAFLLTEAVSHEPAAALATVNAITDTGKLPASALQRSEPHAEQQRQSTGPGTVGDALLTDLQALPVIVRRRQSSPSSSLKALIFV